MFTLTCMREMVRDGKTIVMLALLPAGGEDTVCQCFVLAKEQSLASEREGLLEWCAGVGIVVPGAE